MPKTELTVVQQKNAGYLPINAGDLLAAPVAADVANGNMALVGDGITLRFRNSGASPYTVTINVPNDETGRAGDLTAYNVPVGESHEVWIPPRLAQKSGADAGKVYFSGSNAAILFNVTRPPAVAR